MEWLYRKILAFRYRRALIQARKEREDYGIPTFHKDVRRITKKYLAEAGDLADPCIHYDARTREIRIAERVALLREYGEDLIPLGDEIWPDSSVAIIRHGTKVTSARIVDPRTLPKIWARYV